MKPTTAAPRRSTGFFASLSPEQKRMALQYRGDDSFLSAELAHDPQLQRYRYSDEGGPEPMRA